MILGGTLAQHAALNDFSKARYILFPLAVHFLDLFVSSVGIILFKTKKGIPEFHNQLEDPLTCMKRGYLISLVLSIIGFILICYFLLYT